MRFTPAVRQFCQDKVINMTNQEIQAVVKVVERFRKLDVAISVNDEPACTRCRELCHAVDDLLQLAGNPKVKSPKNYGW